jgi:four helix bundle protein
VGASKIPSFKDLEVWKKAMLLVERIYRITRSYPDEERFGLTAETRKTARSVPYNVAEGKMRISVKEFRHFVSIALGSAGELQTQVLLAQRLRYLGDDVGAGIERDVEEVSRMLRGLERALE